MFSGSQKRCNDAARAAIRLGFHDAGTWSKALAANGQDFGGADGSILKNFGEAARAENNGLQEIIGKLQDVQRQFNVGFADLVQYAAIHAVIMCPLGPRLRTFVGRKGESTQLLLLIACYCADLSVKMPPKPRPTACCQA